MAKDGDLYLACDGSARGGDRATFAVCLSSGDMTTMHVSPHEVMGGPHDSGRAELLALLVLVEYTSDLFNKMANIHLDLHSDSLEAVNFARDPYVGSTPSWADKHNIDLKLRLREVMSAISVNYSSLHKHTRMMYSPTMS